MHNKFRPLTNEELALVSGGNEIVVTGTPPGGGGGGGGGGWGWGWGDGGGGGSGGYDGGGGGGGGGDDDPPPPPPGMDEETEIIVEGTVEALQADIQSYLDELGHDFDIKVGDQTFRASDLVESLDELGKVFDAYEAYQLTDDLLNGDAGLADAIAFVGALAVGAGVTAAAGPLAGFAAGVAAGYLLPGAANYVVDHLATAYDTVLAEAVDSTGYQPANPNWGPATQTYDFLLYIFGIPNNPGPGSDPYYPPPGGGGGGFDPHYNIP
ncbi:hypothetical protein [Erythrobacter rubeus]|uniref:Uncharacterized protein n=1 Tax=Erythrobacter rubeus TaxID=2760803 RepID=A0ABR8KKZ8_9SPHN|nr:hypothetical protein [Erythrobacter rubeus]MBD2840970.1 hypothetical protein [Erythrobacter rubeus]